MGLFSKTQEELDNEKKENFKLFCKKYHLDTNLYDEENIKAFEDIANQYAGDGLLKLGMFIGDVTLKDLYRYLEPRLDAIVMQNFMMIEELKKLNKK